MFQTCNTGHQIGLTQQQTYSSAPQQLLQNLIINITAQVKMLNTLPILAPMRMRLIWTGYHRRTFLDIVDTLTIQTFYLFGVTFVLVEHVSNEVYLINNIVRWVKVAKCFLIKTEFTNGGVYFIKEVGTRKWCHADSRRNSNDIQIIISTLAIMTYCKVLSSNVFR